MNIAEKTSSARHAVGALALAALAVSAAAMTRQTEPEVQTVFELDTADCFAHPVTTLGEVVVVGTDQDEPVRNALEQLTWRLPSCARQAMHVTIYAHLEGGAASAIEVQGDDDVVTECVRRTVRALRFAVDAPVDVMVPVDLVPY